MESNTEEAIDKKISKTVENYREMRKHSPSLYQEAMWTYANMAAGGLGGPTDFTGEHGSAQSSIRKDYYPEYPDSFFFAVLSALGELDQFYYEIKNLKEQ